jgi:hypothetical protein
LKKTFLTRATVKESAAPVVSLYERRKPRQTRPTVFFFLLLVAVLLAVHFLNLFLQWTMIRMELAAGPVFESPAYSFLGFSSFNQKEIAAIRYFENSSLVTRVFGFFDFSHPAIFAIWNKKDMAFIDLGPVVMAVPAGFSRVSFFPGSVFLLQQGKKTAVKYYGDAIAGRAWHVFLTKKYHSPKNNEGQLPASFVVKAPETSRYLKIPYLIYFFLPLLLIGIAVIRFGLGMFAAFLYYVEMFFLFDYQNLFVKIPFGWILHLLNFKIAEASSQFIAAALAIVFVACAVFGFWHWGKREISPWPRRILLLFVLLPLALYL